MMALLMVGLSKSLTPLVKEMMVRVCWVYVSM